MIYDQLNIPQVSKYVTNLICESHMINGNNMNETIITNMFDIL